MNRLQWRRWLVANALGLFVGLPVFGIIADGGLVEHDGPFDIPMHFAGFMGMAAVMAFAQRRAIGARHTGYLLWTAVEGIAVFLVGGVAFELLGPPADFVAGMTALGGATAFLLRREARAAGRPYPRLMVLKGLGAGLASLVGMVPVFLVAQSIDDALGGGLPPFLVIIALLGAIAGVTIATLVRPVAAAVEAELVAA